MGDGRGLSLIFKKNEGVTGLSEMSLDNGT
jgi:hypothetical protein